LEGRQAASGCIREKALRREVEAAEAKGGRAEETG